MKTMQRTYLGLISLWLVTISVTAQIPAGYYDSAQGKNKGALKTALFSIVGSHTAISYNGLWTAFKSTDVRSNGKIWDMYSTCTFTPGNDQCGNYSNVCDCYNREHSFPKSWFNDASPMYSDLFHLYPTDGKVNGQRGNDPYGECAGGTSLGSNALGKSGTSTFPGYTGKVFEPDDEYKGDFARSYFYMATAYDDRIATWSSPQLAGNKYPAFSAWSVNLLLKWTRQDPVSQKEIDRNNKIYANYQHNRNPYIDYPELAEYVWGNKMNDNWYINNTSITDAATLAFTISPNPVSDILHINNSDSAVDYYIYSVVGTQLASGTAVANGNISVSRLPEGVYLIRLVMGKQQQVERFVVNR